MRNICPYRNIRWIVVAVIICLILVILTPCVVFATNTNESGILLNGIEDCTIILGESVRISGYYKIASTYAYFLQHSLYCYFNVDEKTISLDDMDAEKKYSTWTNNNIGRTQPVRFDYNFIPTQPGRYEIFVRYLKGRDSDDREWFNSPVAILTVKCQNHTVVTAPAVPATCTKTGLTEGSHCSVCGEVIEEQQETPALGHDYVGVYTPPAGTTPGYTTYTCSRCGDSYRVNNTGSTLITYTKEAEYTVTIPDSFTLGNTAEEKQVSATGMLEKNQNLAVSISSKQYSSCWQMRSENNDVLPYSIRIGQRELVNHADVLSATALQLNSGSTSTLSFAVKNPPAYAGTYTDTLTFTVSVNANE